MCLLLLHLGPTEQRILVPHGIGLKSDEVSLLLKHNRNNGQNVGELLATAVVIYDGYLRVSLASKMKSQFLLSVSVHHVLFGV